MCRGGRIFAPTKTWRKWHRKINTTQKRYAVASALAPSAVPALVMARGHKVDDVPEIPLVLDTSVESTKKTTAAKDILATVGALADVDKAADSKQIRAGKGKARNRRYVARKGPLIIYKEDDGISQAFRNLPGVELCSVSRLNLLQLAPGGHMGRFCVWSQAAIDELNTIYGSEGKSIPTAAMNNADLARIINSDEVQLPSTLPSVLPKGLFVRRMPQRTSRHLSCLTLMPLPPERPRLEPWKPELERRPVLPPPDVSQEKVLLRERGPFSGRSPYREMFARTVSILSK